MDRARLGHHDAGAEGEGEQISHRDRPLGRNGAFKRPARISEDRHVRQLREQFVDRIAEADRAVLDKGHRAGGNDRLGHRADPADRVGCHRRLRARALEGEHAHRLDVDLAVAGNDGDRTRDEAVVEVTSERVAYPGDSIRREPTGGHFLLLIMPGLIMSGALGRPPAELPVVNLDACVPARGQDHPRRVGVDRDQQRRSAEPGAAIVGQKRSRTR